MSVVQQLVDASKRQDPSYLMMLAQAHAGKGDKDRAIETLQEAVKLLPPDDHSDLRGLMETAMAAYRNGLGWAPENLPSGWLDRGRK